jgi:predicted dehydrogenase
MVRRLKWGVLGAANIARKHVIPAILASERCELVAIASRDEERARAAAHDFGIATAYGSYDALLADPDVEAIYNPLPNHLHAPWTIRALEAGKHVLCEKPIALDAAEAREIASASERTGRLVMEAFMVRFHPQWRKAREITQSGRIGEARAMQTIFSYYLTDPANVRNQRDIGGGGLYDVGCYAINTARYIFGAEPERAIALVTTDPVLGTDCITSGLLAFSEGRQLTFTCATQLVPCQRVQILGTRGRIEVEIPFNAPKAADATVVVDDGNDLAGGGRERIALPACDQYALQCDAFSRAVLGEEPLAATMADAVANMRTIDALFRSARSGAWEAP